LNLCVLFYQYIDTPFHLLLLIARYEPLFPCETAQTKPKMATAVRGIDLLQEQLKKAQEHLKDVDENIKKLTGRSPDDFRSLLFSALRT
jgi:hypothetical protein